MKTLVVILASYLIGSIPFSYIFPKLKGKDVRKGGTKNIGATNVLVVAGPLMGALALIGDIGKGFLAVYFAQKVVINPWIVAFAGIAAVVGHDFSIFLKFKGGKGIATTTGAVLALDPILAIILLLFWMLLIIVTRYFIPSSLIMLGALPVVFWILGKRFEYIVFAILALALALYTHRKDLRRFFVGEELTVQESIAKYLKKS